MRHRVWAVACVLILSMGVAQAASLTPLAGAIDHKLDAHLQGSVTTGPSSILSSIAESEAAPILVQFDLHAAKADATFIQVSRPAPSSNDPTRVASLVPVPTEGQDIETADEQVRYASYVDLKVHPLSTTRLWNLVAYGLPGDNFQVRLAQDDYALGQARGEPQLVRTEIPRSKTIVEALEPLSDLSPDALELRSPMMTASYEGDFTVLLYGAAFDFQTPQGKEKVDTGSYEANYQIRDGGLLPEKRQVDSIVLLRVASGVLTLQAEQAPLQLHARTVSVDGLATFESPSGTLDWGGRAEAADAPQRTLEGQLQIAARGPAYEGPDGIWFSPLTIQGYALAPAYGSALGPLLVIGAGAVAAGASVRWIPGLRRLAFAAIAGFSLVQKDDALEHRSRSQLFEYVRSNPGATLSVAQVHLGVGWGTVEYHVAVLERLGLLVTKRVGGKRLLFAAGQGRVLDVGAWSLMRNPSVRQLGSTLFVPGRAATQVEVAQALDCSPQYAGRLLRKLASAGLVEPLAESARRAFVATDLFHDLGRRTGMLPTPEVPTANVSATA